MKRRWKILTAILLSAAMMVGSMGTGFAAEPAASSATEEDVKETENVSGDNTDIKDDEKNTDEEEAVTSADTENTGEEPAADEDKTNAGSENSEDKEQDTGKTEVTENNVPAASDAPGETADDTVSDSDIEDVIEGTIDDDKKVSYVVHEYTHEYDGKAFNAGKYTVPANSKLTEKNECTAQAVATGGQTYTFPTITKVSENKTYYLYPQSTTSNEGFTEVIKITITPRPVTYRSGTYTKPYDGKPLSQNSAEGAELPKLVKGSMVDGQTFTFNFDPTAQRTDVGSTKNKFTVSNSATADTRNYNTTYEYGNLIVTASRNNINSLPTPEKVKAVVDNKGNIKVSWKKVKSYKSNGKKGGKTVYEVWRYKEDCTWELLGETKKNSFIDKTPGENERFIYKVIAKGIDASGVDGQGEIPAYTRVTPKITSVSPYDGINYARVTFMGLGTDYDEFTLEHWNTKSKGVKDQITVNRYNSTQETYKAKNRTISVNSYLDQGGSSVSISGNNKATFNFRVMAAETTVYDYGKAVKVPASAWSKAAKLKLISMAPKLKGERVSNTSFKLKWNKINKATGYLIEYSRDKDFTDIATRVVYCSKSEKTSTYNNREYEVSDVGFGVPYYCRVTAYNKKKSDGSTYGTALGTSNTIIQYGRQKAVSKLKAEYYEDGNPKADAKLTWEDSEENVKGYYVQRDSYEYNPSTKQYDKLTGHTVLQDYKNLSENATRKKYASTAGGKINNGELIKYTVQSVIYQGAGLGENLDGYVFSEPATYYYMNPTEVQFSKKKIKVPCGGTYTPTLKFKPKKMPKTADGLSKSEFKEKFCLNDTLEFKLESDSLAASDIKKYVTVVTGTGKLTGKSEYTKSYIKLKASSPNDPSTVYAVTTVQVTEGGSSSDSSGETSGLVVCIDAGHGGKDDGATGNSIVEKDMNLKIAKKVGEYLKDGGAKVYYTRTSDEYVSLTDRTDYADEKGCNLFVSIHCNSSTDSGSNGTEVYYSVNSKYAKKSLAESISKAVSGALETRNIGAKSRQGSDGDYYSVIRTSAAKGIPGLIVEHAFISNSSDAAKLKNDDKIDKMAKDEAKAILNNWK